MLSTQLPAVETAIAQAFLKIRLSAANEAVRQFRRFEELGNELISITAPFNSCLAGSIAPY